MNLIGISNENEFYTNHYLNEIFEVDIKEQITSWQEKENESDIYKTPFKKLRGVGADYFELLKELQKKSNTTPEKLSLSREFYKSFLDIFDYTYSFATKDLGELAVPILANVDKSDGSPYLWVVESFCSENSDVLTTTLEKEQLKELDDYNGELNFDAIITSHIFTLLEPPRWIMLISPYQIVLIERAKWAQKRYIRFDIEEILGRKDDSTFKATAVLLHVESLAPKDGLSLLDTLDENSHKHAFGVTEDLKYSLRSAVELLGNEAIYFQTKHNPDFLQTPQLEANLTRESLRYMYRLLFLFYIESRPELGFIPSKSQSFIKGYSLESLRDLELMPLLTDNDKNGNYFHESIALLFDMIYNGRVSPRANMTGKDLFSISPLRSHLFDPAKTPILNDVKLRNHIWQEIIQSLSLSRVRNGNRGRGRISYANLGINQLGAVYEALLSYKGFIAKEELYEVKKADSNPTELENAYFVTEAQLHEYKEAERVFDDGKIRTYKKGTFIYRLAGRDREKSASYYTPEVLTKSLVKYALKELLEIDEHGKIGKGADEILRLTICEPAMGSAAFLNEAINQLSEAYLHQKQVETNEKIAHADYVAELQKVKMHIADNNVYGVDLNSTAVELAEISLWLNALAGSFVPWFGFQLENGNSLIGARREVYEIGTLVATKKVLLWYEDAPKRLAPKSLWPTHKRENIQSSTQQKFDMFEKPKQQTLELEQTKSAGRMIDSQVYHFLLGDKAMSLYNDAVVKSLKKEEIDRIEKWRKEFIKPHAKSEVDKLLRLSLAIDKLWQEQARHLYAMKKKTTDTLHVWGQPKAQSQETNIEYKDTVFMQEKLSADVKNSSPYVRLKIVMDYWCSLWFWPIEKAGFLPTREQFLNDISLLVEKRDDIIMDFDKNLFSETIDDELKFEQITELGFIDVHEQIAKNERLQIVQRVSDAQKFLHWELEFSDVFAKNGGFDLILGNPPWLKVEWEEKGIMGEANPIFDIRKFNPDKLNSLRTETFSKYPKLTTEYVTEYVGSVSTQNYLNAPSNYSILKGIQTDLYKCFLPLSWKIGGSKALIGFVHPEGVYDDSNGENLRKELYRKLKYHFQFQNAKNLFEIAHRKKFSINIYRNSQIEINFINIFNLFLPTTIDLSFSHIGNEIVEGLKDSNDDWNLLGHKKRIINVKSQELKIFNEVFDATNPDFHGTKLPALHTTELLNVLITLAKYKNRISDIKDEYTSTEMFHESYATRDKLIFEKTTFVDTPNDLIFSGPHIYPGIPLYKTPRKICKEKGDYDVLDLMNLDDNYLPRTNYFPLKENIEDFIPRTSFGEKLKVTDFYRLLCRKMLPNANEHTIISAIGIKGASHVNGIVSFIFKNTKNLLKANTFITSIIGDFIIKVSGVSNFSNSWLESFPLLLDSQQMFSRVLGLNCLTSYYKELYEDQFKEDFKTNSWTKKNDPRLNHNFFKDLTPTWNRHVALRADYERRQALVEIDVLVAIELGLTLDELKTIYRIQFPVLKQNENETFYDMNGRIVFTVSKGLTGVGLPRNADKKDPPYKIVINGFAEEKPLGWEDIKEMEAGEIHRTITDDTTPEGPCERTIIYKAPFAKCNREKDYEIAWAEFEGRNI